MNIEEQINELIIQNLSPEMNKTKKFVCVDKDHFDKAKEVLCKLKSNNLGVSLAKKAVKNRKYLKMKTIEDFKRTCSIGDVLFICHADMLCYPMVVISISDDRDEVIIEGYYALYETSINDFSGFDKSFMHKVRAIYPNG